MADPLDRFAHVLARAGIAEADKMAAAHRVEIDARGDRHAGLIVMGLHGSPLLGPRMGSVTYRVLCLAPGLVLAVPPARAAASDQAVVDQNRAVTL